MQRLNSHGASLTQRRSWQQACKHITIIILSARLGHTRLLCYHPVMDTQSGLLSLDDDALLYVFSFLYGKEAHGIALTSKRLHDLANPRLSAIVECPHPFAFLPLCKYILQGAQPRAQYIEILDLRIDGIDEIYNAEEVPYGRLLTDLLVAAQNVRQLTLSCRSGWLERSRIGATLVTMRNLVDLHIRNVDDESLALVSMLSGSLRRLALWFSATAPQSTTTEDALLRALTRHTRLESLELQYFRPPEPIARASSTDRPQFTSLHSLSIALCSVGAVWFIDLFPHLSLLAVRLSNHAHAPLSTDVLAAPRWPPLKELYIDDVFAPIARHLVSRVEKIVIMNVMRPFELDLQPWDSLDAMLRAASPVRFSLSACVGPGVIATLVPILAALPRLRTLELCMQLAMWEGSSYSDSEERRLVSPVLSVGGCICRLTQITID